MEGYSNNNVLVDTVKERFVHFANHVNWEEGGTGNETGENYEGKIALK